MYKVIRSALFWGIYVGLFRYLLCFFKNKRRRIDRLNVVLASLISACAILLESPERRTEIILYMVPKFLEGCYNLMKERGFAFGLEYGEVLVFSIAMGVIMFFYQNEER